MSDKNTLQLATLSATYNILLQISLRVLTFIANAFILRFITRDVLGVINVRLLLLYTTIQFLSREPFRRVAVGLKKTHPWPQVVKLISLSIPLALICGTILSVIWLSFLERPEEKLFSDYGFAVKAMFASVVIELIAEPFYVFAQIQGFIRTKVVADGLLLMTRTLIMVSFVYKWPERAIIVFAYAQIISSLVYLSVYGYYFIAIQRQSFSDFRPKLFDQKPFVDKALLKITISFLKNTTLKQFLTEGERFVMTFFNVITFGEQGVYDVINNIGSLPARLVFQQIEESGYILFTQKIVREKSAEEQSADDLRESALILTNLTKTMAIIGLILLIFGFNYSELALLIYGGQRLSAGLATDLLQWHCVYVLFIAINGITECFTFAAMNSRQIDAFNRKMISISVVFLVSSYLFTTYLGCRGFIMANCLNMASRIGISLNFIQSYYGRTRSDSPLKGSVPHKWIITSFAVTFAILFSVKSYLCCSSSLKAIIVYIILGGFCLFINLCIIYSKERELYVFITNLYKTKNTSKVKAFLKSN